MAPKRQATSRVSYLAGPVGWPCPAERAGTIVLHRHERIVIMNACELSSRRRVAMTARFSGIAMDCGARGGVSIAPDPLRKHVDLRLVAAGGGGRGGEGGGGPDGSRL